MRPTSAAYTGMLVGFVGPVGARHASVQRSVNPVPYALHTPAALGATGGLALGVALGEVDMPGLALEIPSSES